MLPIDFECRRCWAAVGSPCLNPDGSLVLVAGNPFFHWERFDAADSQSVEGANVSKEEFGEAVQQSGLIV